MSGPDLTITIPLELTVELIVRASPTPISESAARELALELHDLIAEVRTKFVTPREPLSEDEEDEMEELLESNPDEYDAWAAKRPLVSDGRASVLRAQLVYKVYSTAVAYWPYYEDEADTGWAVAEESVDVAAQLTDISDDIYDRYLRLHDRINGTNFAETAVEKDLPKDLRFLNTTQH